MKKIIFFSVVALGVFLCYSCTKKQQKVSTESKIVGNTTSELQDEEGYELFKQTCYVCHSVTTTSHDQVIAPPMEAVKRRYMRSYPDEESFVNAVVAFAKEPSEDKALMFGAVQQYKVMPLQNFEEEKLRKIATYIYTNEIEKPEWFESHFSEEHPNGMGKGNGMGRGMGRGGMNSKNN